ncbi:hypothetical protein IWX46DRAFT_421092 [Phyllosticta citricarpa]|uniref:Uncharacterized protein n=1 Tax=Phyllosticta citricarpa TaxID=55181 RepID=A0ABR1ML06_9PEZI
MTKDTQREVRVHCGRLWTKLVAFHICIAFRFPSTWLSIRLWISILSWLASSVSHSVFLTCHFLNLCFWSCFCCITSSFSSLLHSCSIRFISKHACYICVALFL